jgi:hypothetical protein
MTPWACEAASASAIWAASSSARAGANGASATMRSASERPSRYSEDGVLGQIDVAYAALGDLLEDAIVTDGLTDLDHAPTNLYARAPPSRCDQARRMASSKPPARAPTWATRDVCWPVRY